MFRFALLIVLTLSATPAFAQCPDGVCIVPSPHGCVGADEWPSPLVPVADASLTRRLAASTVRIVHEVGGAQSIGSGAIVDKNGPAALVLTCGHLFREGIGRVVVVAPNGRTYAARVLDVDSAWDIAALMIAAPDAPAISIAPSPPGGSETLAYCGYGPEGRFASGAGRLLQYVRMHGTPSADTLQLTGAARQGDSGGPIVNARGQLVGLIVGTDGRVVIGPSCRPIRRFLQRFVGPAVPAGNNDVQSQVSAPRQEEQVHARAQNGSEQPASGSSRRHSAESMNDAPTSNPLTDAPASIPAGTAGPTDVLTLLIPLLLAALGISVPPTSVFVALRVLRCIRRGHLRKLRRQRRNRKGQHTIDKQEPDPCPLPADQAACDRKRVVLERHLNDDYAGQLASVFAHSGQSPLQDATLGREFSREIDRAASSSDAKLEAWAAELRDRVMRRFHRIHGWTPSPAEPLE